eukprot:1013868-Amorphochlora_amoeboformis.AAC.1
MACQASIPTLPSKSSEVSRFRRDFCELSTRARERSREYLKNPGGAISGGSLAISSGSLEISSGSLAISGYFYEMARYCLESPTS